MPLKPMKRMNKPLRGGVSKSAAYAQNRLPLRQAAFRIKERHCINGAFDETAIDPIPGRSDGVSRASAVRAGLACPCGMGVVR